MADAAALVLALYIFSNADSPPTPATVELPSGSQRLSSLRKPVTAAAFELLSHDYSYTALSQGDLFIVDGTGEIAIPPGSPLPPTASVDIKNDSFVVLNISRVPAAAGGAAAGAGSAAASPAAGITAGLGKLKLVSFERPKTFVVVRYDTDLERTLLRPLDFTSLMGQLEHSGLYSAGEGICFFPFKNSEWTPDSRIIRLTADTFDDWNNFDLTSGLVPKIWIYPRPTPTKPPRAAALSPVRAGSDKDSAMTPAEYRLVREEAFEVDVRAQDKFCRFPGCKEVYVPGTTVVEAAHIIPRYILNIKRYNSNQLYKDILDAAEFSRLDIDTPRNGMLLCANHHKSFDNFWWTFFPPTEDKPGSVQISTDARKTFATMLTAVDFSHRKGGQRPPATVWGAYNALVFPDAGKALKAAAKFKEPEAVGGGAAGGSS